MTDLRSLAKRERRLLNTLNDVERFINNYDPATDECQVSVRLERLEAVCKEFYEVREQIELLMEDDDDESDPERRADSKRDKENQLTWSGFEDRYCRVKASLLTKQIPPPSTSTSVGIGQPTGDHSVGFSKVKLPEIRLPSFSGSIKD